MVDDAHQISAGIEAFVNDHTLTQRAYELAQRLATRTVPDGAEVAANAVRAVLPHAPVKQVVAATEISAT